MAAELVHTIAALRARLSEARCANTPVGLVPTMGALHEGHAALIERARRECGTVAVSIFVNPLQFDREEDLRAYPRTLEADTAICLRLGVDVVFAPSVEEMYPTPPLCTVEVGRIADYLCGKYRPGHFRGVATVVMKLIQIAQADRAYFGEKDRQQLAIVRRMVADLNVPIQIVGVPTVREPDGLAVSSRNRRLGPDERGLAVALFRTLREAERQISVGVTDPEIVKTQARTQVPGSPLVRLEYLEVVDPEEMSPVAQIAGPVIVAGALWVGTTRLIDNLACSPPWP